MGEGAGECIGGVVGRGGSAGFRLEHTDGWETSRETSIMYRVLTGVG